jgi:hypothetical protein
LKNAIQIISIGKIQNKTHPYREKIYPSLPAHVHVSCLGANQASSEREGRLKNATPIFKIPELQPIKHVCPQKKTYLLACRPVFLPSFRLADQATSEREGRLKNAEPVHGIREPQPKKGMTARKQASLPACAPAPLLQASLNRNNVCIQDQDSDPG